MRYTQIGSFSSAAAGSRRSRSPSAISSQRSPVPPRPAANRIASSKTFAASPKRTRARSPRSFVRNRYSRTESSAAIECTRDAIGSSSRSSGCSRAISSCLSTGRRSMTRGAAWRSLIRSARQIAFSSRSSATDNRRRSPSTPRKFRFRTPRALDRRAGEKDRHRHRARYRHRATRMRIQASARHGLDRFRQNETSVAFTSRASAFNLRLALAAAITVKDVR